MDEERQPNVWLFNLLNGEQVVSDVLVPCTEEAFILSSPGVLVVGDGAMNGPVNVGFHHWMPFKTGKTVTLQKSAVVAHCEVDKESKLYKAYAAAFLGQKIITAEKKLILG